MFIGLLMLSAAPVAQPMPAKGQTPTAKIECRMIQEPGSRIPTKICRLDKEWDLLAKDAQDSVNTSRNKTIGANSPTGN